MIKRCETKPVSEAHIVKRTPNHTTHLSMFEFVVVVIRYNVDVSKAFLIFKHQSHVQIVIEGLDLHIDNVIL